MNNHKCINRYQIAAPHFKDMANMKLLSKAFFNGRHHLGAMGHFLRQFKNQKRVSSIIVD